MVKGLKNPFQPVKEGQLLSLGVYFLDVHFPGAIKFSVPDGDKVRIGFIIIDLNIQLNVPIILMEDERPAHLGKFFMNRTKFSQSYFMIFKMNDTIKN